MGVKLEVRHLKLLTAVAEEGSVTAAGKRLHLTQSALSHQLKDAEEMLGTALFLRLGKKMVPTAAGETLLACAYRVLQELASTEARIDGLDGEARGSVRLSTECYTCYHWLPPVLQKFHKRFPKVNVNIDAQVTNSAAEALLQGKLDVAVLSDPPKNRSLRLTPMFEDEVFIIMSPDHRLAAAAQIQPRDLAGETILVYPPKEESTLLNAVMKPAGVEPGRLLELPLTEVIIEMAAAGNGIGFLAGWAVALHVQTKRIVARPLSNRGFRRQWYAATLRNQPAPPFLAEFVELLSTCSPKQARRQTA